MKKIKAAFKEDPIFAITITLGAASVLAALMTGSAKLIEASAYAHRASKMK